VIKLQVRIPHKLQVRVRHKLQVRVAHKCERFIEQLVASGDKITNNQNF